MNRKIGLSVAAGAIILLLIGGSLYYFVWRHIESTDNAYVEGDISVISAKITGYVHEITVSENQSVSRGQPLVLIAPKEFQAKQQKAQAALDLAQASLENIAAKIILQNSSVLEAQADVQKATAAYDISKKNADRAVNLMRNDFSSQKMLETAQADFLEARATAQKAQATLQAQRQQILVLETEKKQSEATLASAQADLILAQQDLDDAKIISPIDGYVGNKAVQQGQLVQPGQYLLSVVPKTCYIFANFKETQLSKIGAGCKAKVTADAYSDHTFEGTVESMSPASGSVFSLLPPENATGNFTKIVQRIPVKITFDDPKQAQKLRPGMSVVVKVDTRSSTPSP